MSEHRLLDAVSRGDVAGAEARVAPSGYPYPSERRRGSATARVSSYHAKLARALARQGGLFSLNDILERIANGTMQSWVEKNSWAVTQISIFPRRRILEIVAVVGDLGDCRILHDEIIKFADKMGVDLVAAYGRLGWLKDARKNGWTIKTQSYLYHKEL